MPHEEIRVRIAPSPTGYLHLGTVRTAFFNYLFAKKEGGKFVIRIEDTDQGRSLPVYEQDILEGLKILNVSWDEGPDIGGPYGPYRQSERTELYTAHIQKLLDEKRAYYCFCSKEELESERQAMLAQGLFPKYSGKCRSLSAQDIEAKKNEGNEGVIRMVVPGGSTIEFHDLIRGKVSVQSDTLGDMVIARSLTSPLYNLAVVVDDFTMNISHVIRGEDHISNTPKQILIQRALGFPEPIYAHLPLILAPDRSKLSKRSLETSFIEYIHDGFLPEAILNFLVLMGWHPEGDDEIMDITTMIKKFNIKKVQKAGAVFSMDKLEWFNAHYIKTMPLENLMKRMTPFIPEAWIQQKEMVKKILAIERERMKKLSDFKELAAFFFTLDAYDAPLLRWQDIPFETVLRHLRETRELLAPLDEASFTDMALLEQIVMPMAEKEGRGEVLWPLRVALSGKRNSPGPFEIMNVLGKEESLRRIDAACATIPHNTV